MKEKLKNIMLMDKIRINGTGMLVASMGYMYISVIIFLLGWVKPIFSIPTTIILLIAIYKYIKEKSEKLKEIKPIYVSVKMLLLVLVIVCIFGWLFGWTGRSKQTADWEKHNGVLADLTKKEWPVYYENNGEKSMLTYYLGQYMVPTVVGKLFSSVKIAQYFNGIWAMIGLLIAILGIFKITKSDNSIKQLKALIIIFGFSMCISVSQVLVKLFIDKDIVQGHWLMFNENFKLQYSNNIILLRWVMPQCLITWIVLTIIYDDPYDLKNYVLVCLPVLFYSSITFIGLVLFLLVLLIIYIIKNRKKENVLKNIFSISNILIAITLGLILILYFLGNVLGEKDQEIGFKIVKYGFSNISLYIFLIVAVIPYTLILFSKNKRNPFYWIATVIMFVFPFFSMGLYNDLLTRGTIIPLFIYMIMSINLLNDKEVEENIKMLMIITLIVGSFSSILEFSDTLNSASLKFSVEQKYTLEENANRSLKINNDLKYNYYTYDLDDDVFYKYIALRKLNK